MSSTASSPHSHDDDRDYSGLLDAVSNGFASLVGDGITVFATDASGLFEAYLGGFDDPTERQHHNCYTCRRFIETYGGLVRVERDGRTTPLFWNPDTAPELYRTSFTIMQAIVGRARIVSPFHSKEPMWGTPITGQWHHFAVRPPRSMIHTDRLRTPFQVMAAAKENFRTVSTALADLSDAALDQALRVLEADAVNRAEKFVAPLRWLRALHDRPKGRAGENLLWLAVATAPDGFMHPRAAVTASLLEDIVAGLAFEDIRRRFNAKVNPLLYQRPQVAPTAGNIKRGEEVIAKLGLERSLERRFARLDEIETIWRPRPAVDPQPAGGVFGHLAPKAAAPSVKEVSLPQKTMTWEKFSRTIMPTAESIDLMVPARGPFIAFVSAVHADAPPIYKWDREDARNPVSWYVYFDGSTCDRWGLVPGYRRVTGIANLPPMWGDNPQPHLGEGAVLILDGAVDRDNTSLSLFPESLIGPLHEVRATIEAFSRSRKLEGANQASACGYDLRKSSNIVPVELRVTSAAGVALYRVDRWD